MPVFEIQTPDGKTYEIDAPDQQTAINSLSGMKPEKPSVGMDMLKSAGTGLAEGAIGMAGMFGDAAKANETIMRKGAEYLGAPQWAQDAAGTAGRYLLGPMANAPTSEQVAAPVKSVTGEFYQPQTTAGNVMRTAGNLAPGIALGPGGAIPKAAGLVGATAGNELAGYMADGKWYEPYAKAVGSILGGGAAAGLSDFLTMPIPQDMTRKSAALLKTAIPDDMTGFQTLGPEARLLDAGPSATGLAQGVAVSPGKNADDIINAVTARNDTRSSRLVSDAQSTFGRGRDPELRKMVIGEAASRKAGPMYENLVQNAPQLPPTLGPQLAKSIRTSALDLSKGRRDGINAWTGKIYDAVNAKDPSVAASRLWDLRKDLDSQIVYDSMALQALPSADKSMQSVFKDLRGTVDDILKNRFNFDVPDAIIAKGKRAQESIDYGYNLLDGGKTAKSPQAVPVDTRMQKLDPQFIREGATARISNAMGTQASDLAALKKMLGGDNGWNRQKLNDLFGGGKVDKAVGAVDRESLFAQNFADITRNSQTARRAAAQKLVDGTDAPMFTSQDSTTGLALKGAAKVANALVRGVAKNMNETNKTALTKALLKKGPEAEKLASILKSMPNPAATALIQALLAGVGATSGARVGTGQVPSPSVR